MKKTCSRGKHSTKNKKLNKKKVVLIIIIIIVLVLLAIYVLKKDKNIQPDNENYIGNINIENELVNSEIVNEENTTIIEKVDMPNNIENYKVIGQLVIEKIGIEKYILNKTTDYSLDLSVTKLYGPKVNEQGNLCIIGHNSKEVFVDLKDLKKDDTFYIIDKENFEKVTYKIYDKYTINPTDLDCLNQNTNDKREVTLITCNPRRVNQTYNKSTRGIEVNLSSIRK